MTTLKIAIIAGPTIPVPPKAYGGIERIVFMLIQELIKMGHEVTLFAHPASQPNCKLIPYQESQPYGLIDFLRINWLTHRQITGRFDILHTFGRMSNIALLMPKALPKIVSYQLPPTVSQVKKAMRMAKQNSLFFTACSQFIAKQIQDIATVKTIYNGVSLLDYDFNPSVSTTAPLVFLGRIQHEKGTHIAIEVAKKTNHKLIIAGNIPNETLHQRYFKEKIEPFIDGEQIRYIGPVNNQQKNKILGDAKAFLMPVLWDEPFGIVMAEALACGTPILGFNRGAIPEVVHNHVNGWVCKDVEDMVKAVARLETISRATCRQTVEDHFSASVLAKQYEDLYLQLAKKS